MHNFITTLLSIFFLTTGTISATPLAQASPSTPPPTSPDQESKCTFTLFHRQLPAQKNYIQINTLLDHANNLTIDIAHLRPVAAFNTYARLSARQVFAIEGLLGGRNLTVRAEDGGDEVRFEVGGWAWSSEDGVGEGKEVWCVTEGWNAGGGGNRERKMECAFPCERIEDGEEGYGERAELR